MLCEQDEQSKQALAGQQEEIDKLKEEVKQLKKLNLVPPVLKRQTTVFSFGDTAIQTFEEHKQQFGTKYYEGKDINFNDRKMIDFHEDVLKQMYLVVDQQKKETELMKQKVEELETKVKNVVDVLENEVEEGRKTLNWGSLRNFSPSPANHAMFDMTEKNMKLYTKIIKDLK